MITESKQQRLHCLQRRMDRAQAWLAVLQKAESRFPWIRLGILLAGLLAVFIAAQVVAAWVAWGIGLVGLAVFVYVTRRHQSIIDRAARIETFARLLKEHIARLTLDWANIPAATPLQVEATHPFNADLDITGSRSLHQLLDTTVSLEGSRSLAACLLETQPQPERITHRQTLVRELIALPGFRLRLELNGMLADPGSQGRWDGSALLGWLQTHISMETLRPRLIVLAVLAAANIILFLLNAFGNLPPYWLITFVLYFGIQATRHRETSEVFEESYTLARQLGQLYLILTDLEDYPYQTGSRLRQLADPFLRAGQRPSAALRRIGRIVSAASLRNNPFLSLLLNILVPWDLFFAYQLEHYKRDLSHILPEWLETWYEMESVTALANYAGLRPENIFPDILPAGTQPVFTAKGLRHPLIADEVSVDNDFQINQLGAVTIITGSNMSGKSTFLRTVGTNLVLAFAGSTVPARALQTLPFRLYTSMNVSDSLADGISFFYAEVRRLRALLAALEISDTYPLFFLIDEIFRGTNNKERQLGSFAYTQALAGRNGCGLISTHDLELVHISDTIPLVNNRHFREEIRDGKMVFDYKIRSGASPTTNALKIMAMAGLPVPTDSLQEEPHIKNT